MGDDDRRTARRAFGVEGGEEVELHGGFSVVFSAIVPSS
jgi:hypothetical protein